MLLHSGGKKAVADDDFADAISDSSSSRDSGPSTIMESPLGTPRGEGATSASASPRLLAREHLEQVGAWWGQAWWWC